MALSPASALHWWSSRYGPVPVVGGLPHHTRNSAASTQDQRGMVINAIINTPREAWNSIAAERRKTLLLEMAATNPLSFPSDFTNAAWAKVSVTPAAGIADPMNGTGACTLTATAAGGTVQQALAAGSSIVRNGALWLRRRTGSGVINILSPDTGTYYPAAVTANWLRFNAPGVASVNRWAGINIVTSGDAVDAYDYQIDDFPFASSSIIGGATRSADSFYWDYPPTPQGLMLYVRFAESGTIKMASTTGLLSIGNGAGAEPLLLLEVSSNFYTCYHGEGGAGNVQASMAAAPAIGQVVELVAILSSNGSVQLIQSLDGAAVTASALSGVKALSAAWADTKLWLNQYTAGTIGSAAFADVRLVKLADVVSVTNQGIMEELRGYELALTGDML
jgi:hypothetical protein